MACRLWRWCVQAVFQRRRGVWAICLPIDMRSTVSSTEEEQEDLFGRESSVCQIVILFVVYKYKHRCYLCTIHFQSSHTSPNNNVKIIVVNNSVIIIYQHQDDGDECTTTTKVLPIIVLVVKSTTSSSSCK